MNISKPINNGNSQLLLFFSGWSASPSLFTSVAVEEGTDLWIVYDYRDMSFQEDLSQYQEIQLIAWSMGVWAANYLFYKNLLSPNISRALAINGTPCPLSDTLGIPEAIFRGTLDTLTEEGFRRFNRRMCGSRELLDLYEQSAPLRPLDEVHEELQRIYDTLLIINNLHPSACSASPNPNKLWTQAIIGTDDRIFPAANQRNYWHGRCPAIEIATPHYPFHLWKQWNEIWKQ